MHVHEKKVASLKKCRALDWHDIPGYAHTLAVHQFVWTI